MFCPNCGGEYADWALKCPYCGSVNDTGSELIYMEHLEQIRKRLDLVDEEAEDTYRNSILRSRKKILRLAGLAIFVAVVLSICGILLGRQFSRNSELEYVRQTIWAREEYPKLDAWYEAGDYDRILEEQEHLISSGSEYSIYDWTHATFVCEYYEYKKNLEAGEALFERGSLTMDDDWILTEALYSGLYLKGVVTDAYLKILLQTQQNNGCYGLTQEEASFVKSYREAADHFLEETLGWGEQEISEALSDCMDGEFVRWSKCQELAQSMIKARSRTK